MVSQACSRLRSRLKGGRGEAQPKPAHGHGHACPWANGIRCGVYVAGLLYVWGVHPGVTCAQTTQKGGQGKWRDGRRRVGPVDRGAGLSGVRVARWLRQKSGVRCAGLGGWTEDLGDPQRGRRRSMMHDVSLATTAINQVTTSGVLGTVVCLETLVSRSSGVLPEYRETELIE